MEHLGNARGTQCGVVRLAEGAAHGSLHLSCFRGSLKLPILPFRPTALRLPDTMLSCALHPQVTDWSGLHEMGAQKSGCDANGSAWHEAWIEKVAFAKEKAQHLVERTCHKQGRAGEGH